MTDFAHCPYTQRGLCTLVARYDTTPVSDNAVESITANLDDDDVVAALEAAAGKVYRGSICETCGTWFAAS